MHYNIFRDQNKDLFRHCSTAQQAFITSCQNGNLELAQQLVENFVGINVSIDWHSRYSTEEAFQRACVNGHLHMAQWLKSIKPDIDHKIWNNFPIKMSFIHNKFDVTKWLCTLYGKNQLSSLVDFCFENCNHEIILHIIAWHEIDSLVIVEPHQQLFDKLILQHKSQFATKSARK